MGKGSVLTALGLLLIAAALCLSGYNLWETHQAAEEAKTVVDQLTQVIPTKPTVPTTEPATQPQEPTTPPNVETIPPEETEPPAVPTQPEIPDYIQNPDMEMPVQTVNGTDYIGILRIPTLNLELPIISQWSYKRLKVAPCRYTGSVYQKNMTICAHNYSSHFGRLKNLSIGDIVTFTDMDGNEFIYRVAELETLMPSAVEEMTAGIWDLTLFTCTVGGKTRVTVRCEAID